MRRTPAVGMVDVTLESRPLSIASVSKLDKVANATVFHRVHENGGTESQHIITDLCKNSRHSIHRDNSQIRKTGKSRDKEKSRAQVPAGDFLRNQMQAYPANTNSLKKNIAISRATKREQDDNGSESMTFAAANILQDMHDTAGRNAEDILESKGSAGETNTTSVLKIHVEHKKKYELTPLIQRRTSVDPFAPAAVEHVVFDKLQKSRKKIPSKSAKIQHIPKIPQDSTKSKPKAKRPQTSAAVKPVSFYIEQENVGSAHGRLSSRRECKPSIVSGTGFGVSRENCQYLQSKISTTSLPVSASVNINSLPKTHSNLESNANHSNNSICTSKFCNKCNMLAQKLRSQLQNTKNLHRQNGCLENIVAQKRHLVEQLTRQLRYLIKENYQLARVTGVPPSVMDEKSLTNKLSSTSTSLQSPNENSSLPMIVSNTLADLEITLGSTSSSTNVNVRGRSPISRPSSRRSSSVSGFRDGAVSPERLEEAEHRIETLQKNCESLQEQLGVYRKDQAGNKRFMNDLLYTLNARGYETVTDQDGNIIDLHRCKGESLLDLKGRDARQRAPTLRRLTPHDTLLKAVIGSQERLIQNVLFRLDSQQKDLLLGDRLSSEPFSSNASDLNRSADLECELLSLVGLIEGTCQRHPETYIVLQEQHVLDSQVKKNSGMNPKNPIVDTLMDRCQELYDSFMTPTSSRSRARTPCSRESDNCRVSSPPSFTPRYTGSGRTMRIRPYLEGSTPLSNHSSRASENNNAIATSSSASAFLTQSAHKNSFSNGRPITAIDEHRQTHRSRMTGRVGSAINSDSHDRLSSVGRRASSTDTRTTERIESSSMSATKRQLSFCPSNRLCPYCNETFSLSINLTEISSHMQIHNFLPHQPVET